jgi:energy-coupling factor transporter ATP-binding protein EcfA2
MTNTEIKPEATELNPKKVSFPPSASLPELNQEVQCQTSIVVVGANGSGKSRLGSWLELKGPQKERVHRIAAQRSLVFPENSSPIGFEKARDAFYWAPAPPNWDREQYEQNKPTLRLQHRYGGSVINAETAPLSDFEALVTLLFSENYSALLSHEEQQRKTQDLIPMPNTLLRRVQALWENLLPSRSLIMKSSEVQVAQKSAPENAYSARAMSDGERVIFYLIGQCLCAPQDGIIVVDEPEIHLHKAIQNALWDALEKARPDCTFVYLTHDLPFAADRIGATKICINEFLDGAFSWYSKTLISMKFLKTSS